MLILIQMEWVLFWGPAQTLIMERKEALRKQR